MYGSDGRLMVLIVHEARRKPADAATVTDEEAGRLFRELAAYGGTYTFDGKAVVHHVDIAWNEAWTGTDQVRNARIEGGRLILSTGPEAAPPDDEPANYDVTWERVSSLRLRDFRASF